MQTLPCERQVAAGAGPRVGAIGDAHIGDADIDAAFARVEATAGGGERAAAWAGRGEALQRHAALIEGEPRVQIGRA